MSQLFPMNLSELDIKLTAITNKINDTHYEDALIALNELQTLMPNDPKILFLRAGVLADQEQYEEAKETFEQLLAIRPDFYLAHYQLAFLALLSSDFECCSRHIVPLLQLDDSQELYHFGLGIKYVLEDNEANAILSFETGILLNTTNPALNTNVRKVIQLLVGDNEAQMTYQTDEPEEKKTSNDSTNSLLLNIYNNQTY